MTWRCVTTERLLYSVCMGILEVDREDCSDLIIETIKLGLNVPVSAIKRFQRLGNSSKEHHRPVVVKFFSLTQNFFFI